VINGSVDLTTRLIAPPSPSKKNAKNTPKHAKTSHLPLTSLAGGKSAKNTPKPAKAGS
jgi:hypothetical protein